MDNRKTVSVNVAAGSEPVVSVIVPVRQINAFIREALPLVLKNHDVQVEWICLPDSIDEISDDIKDDGDRVRIIPTGSVGPAQKRDIGARVARGAFLAFLDDDAYPSLSWLAAALPHFENESVAAVGGPGVTPPGDSFWQQASGWALASRLGSGGARHRYLALGRPKDIDDWPTMNLIVRARDFSAVGGFNCDYFPGEDTKLCLALVHHLGKRIVYEPRALVYHHRRDLFWGHFLQIGRYGEFRGHFVRALPKTSRRPIYFAPTILLLLVVTYPAIAIISPYIGKLVRSVLGVYVLLLGATAVEVTRATSSLRLGLAATGGVALTHLWYGTKFLVGLWRPPSSLALAGKKVNENS